MNKFLCACLLPTAFALLPAHAEVRSNRSSLGVRLVITSQCSAQYTPFGPRAMSPISVVCIPGATPFMTFSSILYNVATEPGEADAHSSQPSASAPAAFAAAGTAAELLHAPVSTAGPTFSISNPASSVVGPLGAPSKTNQDQATEIVHVTF